MMARNEPLLPIPSVSEGITGRHHLPGPAEGEGVQSGIDGDVAAEVDAAQVDLAGRFIEQEGLEIFFSFRRHQLGWLETVASRMASPA